MNRSASDVAAAAERRPLLAALVCLGLVLLALAAYAPVRHNDFIDLDDADYITDNAHVRTGLTRDNVVWAWTTTHHGYYHPLTWLSLQSDVSIFGYNAWGMHATNLALHIAVCVLLFLVFSRITAAFWPSAFFAALFAVHPMHVESVAWAAERKDVLSTFFLVLTLAAYVRATERSSWVWHLVAAVLFTLGLLAKPMLVTLPFGLLLLDVWPLRRLTFPSARIAFLIAEKGLLFALAITFSVLTFYLQREVGAVLTTNEVPVGGRIGNALNGYVWYVWKTLVPVNLAVFHVHRLRIPWYEALASAAVLVAITAGCAWRFRQQPYLLVGWLWFLGTLFPVSGVAQSGEQAYADRFAYVPHIGLLLSLIWGVRDLARRRKGPAAALTVLSAAILGGCTALTYRQLRHWQTTETIWENTLAVTGKNYRAHASLSLYYYGKHDLDSAALHANLALACEPNFPEGYYNLGRILLDQGDYRDAEVNFRQSLRYRKKLPDAEHNLGYVLLLQNKTEAGVRVYRRLVDADPNRADSQQMLGIGLAAQGEFDAAAQHFDKALELQPVYPKAHNQRGLVDLRRGDPAAAETHFRRAVEQWPEYAAAWENLGLALSRGQRPAEAADAFRKALALESNRLEAIGNLAQALYEQGKKDEAMAEYRRLSERFPRWTTDAAENAMRLATHADAAQRNGPRAAELALQACQATDYKEPHSLEALTAALAELGRFHEAQETLRCALDLDALTPETRQRLESVRESLRARRPLRPPPDAPR